MMADKFKKTLPVDITFTAGENVTPAKLNALSSSIRTALSTIESFIGDGWDDSYPYFDTSDTLTLPTQTNSNADLGTDKKLEIVNLSRLVGPASALNPMHLSDLEVAEKPITETVPSSVNHFNLRYATVDTSTISFTGGAGIFDTRKTTISTLLVAGDYYVNSATGEVVTVAPTTGGITVTYSTTSTWDAFSSHPGASFNVIPDPAQATKCVVTGPSSGAYTLTLPVITHQEANDSVTLTALSSSNYNYNVQLKLPKVLESLTSGSIIPSGFLVVRDDTSGTVYREATYAYTSETVLTITGVTLDTTHGFSVITIGTNITQSIQHLQYKLFRMRRGLDTTYAINMDNVIGKAGPSRNTGLGVTAEPYVPSEAPNNHFPQYLHRDGWFGSYYDDVNINDSNGMRGDLVMLSTSRVTNSRNNLSADSQKVRFGHDTDGPSISYHNAAVNTMRFEANTSDYFLFEGAPVVGESGFAVGYDPTEGPIKWYIYQGNIAESSNTFTASIPSLIGKTILGVTGCINISADLWWGQGASDSGIETITEGVKTFWSATTGLFGLSTGTLITGSRDVKLIIFYMD